MLRRLGRSCAFGVLAAGVGLLVGAMPLWAHHAFGVQFDPSQAITVKGVITEVKWENPHMWVYVDVTDKSGKVASWGFEANGPASVIRSGVKPDVLKPGQEVTIHGFRARDSSRNFGTVREVVLADGRSLIIGPGGKDPEPR